MKSSLFHLLAALCLAGCNSADQQKERFVEYHNRQVGLPYYSHEKRGMKEVRISDTVSEFVPETIPTETAVVAWTVDTTQRGPSHHRNGMTFQIEGIKKSWRMLGDPEKARLKINWGGG